LTGTVLKFVASPIAFGRSDFAAEFRARAQVSATLKDRQGTVIWQARDISAEEEYDAPADIFASEANKRRAIERLAADLAEQIHDRIFDGL
jgi:hypothetical protein